MIRYDHDDRVASEAHDVSRVSGVLHPRLLGMSDLLDLAEPTSEATQIGGHGGHEPIFWKWSDGMRFLANKKMNPQLLGEWMVYVIYIYVIGFTSVHITSWNCMRPATSCWSSACAPEERSEFGLKLSSRMQSNRPIPMANMFQHGSSEDRFQKAQVAGHPVFVDLDLQICWIFHVLRLTHQFQYHPNWVFSPNVGR